MKTLKYLFIAALAIFTFNACEDVPAPYDIPAMSGNGSGSGSGSGENTNAIFEQDFSSSLGSFTQNCNNPDVQWVNDYSSAVAKGYVDGKNLDAVSYLVSPSFDLTGKEAAHVALKYVICYANTSTVKENHQLLISDNFTGDATKTNWTVLDYGAVNSSSFTFGNATVDIPAEFLGKSNVNIAFRYKSTTEKASTWEIKSVAINDGAAPEQDEEETPGDIMTVAEALASYTGTAKQAVVKGYIVGYIPDKSIDEAVFGSSATSQTNIILADTPDETNISKCIPIQLPSGDIRNKVNLQSNPGNYKKVVTLTGSLEKYFGVTGLKAVSKALFEGEEDSSDDKNEPTGNIYLNETFAKDLGSFTTAQIVNEYAWKHEVYNDKAYAKVSGYADGASQDAESWLISPAMNFSNETAATINFDYVINKGETSLAAANHKLMITDSYTGDFYTTTWDEIDFGATNDGTWTFRNSGNIAVPETFMGKEAVVIAFKYTSTTSASSTWEVMNVVVTGGEGGNQGGDKEEEEGGNAGGSLDGITVAQALAAYTGSATPATVKGYIVGWIDGMAIATGAQFNSDAASKTNLILADTPDETNVSRCLPIQLPSGDIRNALNLQDNPGNYKKYVSLTGSLEKYFGVAGLKTVTKAVFEGSDNNEGGEGDKEEDNDTPTTEPNTIAGIIAAGPGSAVANGTIIATYARGFLMSDNTAAILVFLGEDKGFSTGDVVTVSGTTSTYAGLLQFGNTSTVTKTGTSSVTAATAKEMSAADMDAYLSKPSIQYVSYKGTLEISGNYYNVTIAGAATAIGSISYPNSGLIDASLNGKEIIVTGYTIGVSKDMYVNTMATSIVASTTNEPEIDDTPGIGDEPENGDDPETEDTPATPVNAISVADAIAAYNNGTVGETSVTGYIVGWVQRGNKPQYTTASAAATNLILADSPEYNDATIFFAVELPTNSDIRTALNLSNNPDMFGKKVTITGSLETYYGGAGLKSPSAFTIE